MYDTLVNRYVMSAVHNDWLNQGHAVVKHRLHLHSNGNRHSHINIYCSYSRYIFVDGFHTR